MSNDDSLDVVELFVANLYQRSPAAADVVINLRQGDIFGPVVGTSLPVSIPFNAIGTACFESPSQVQMVEGNHFMKEIVIVAGQEEREEACTDRGDPQAGDAAVLAVGHSTSLRATTQPAATDEHIRRRRAGDTGVKQ